MTAPRLALGELFAPTAAPTPTPTAQGGESPTPPTPRPHGGPTEAHARAVAVDELIGFPMAWLSALPMACTLVMRHADGGTLAATTGRANHAALTAAGVPCLTGRGLGALALGAENDRASRDVLAGWLRAGGGLSADPPIDRVALGGVYALQTPNHRWPLGRVLAAWGLTLVGVAVGDGPNCEVLA